MLNKFVFTLCSLLLFSGLLLAQTAEKNNQTTKEDKLKKKTETVSFMVKGMSCPACAGFVDGAAAKVDGVAQCQINFKEKRADIEYDPAKTDPQKIEAALKTTGFGIAMIEKKPAEKKANQKDPEKAQKKDSGSK